MNSRTRISVGRPDTTIGVACKLLGANIDPAALGLMLRLAVILKRSKQVGSAHLVLATQLEISGLGPFFPQSPSQCGNHTVFEPTIMIRQQIQVFDAEPAFVFDLLCGGYSLFPCLLIDLFQTGRNPFTPVKLELLPNLVDDR